MLRKPSAEVIDVPEDPPLIVTEAEATELLVRPVLTAMALTVQLADTLKAPAYTVPTVEEGVLPSVV